MPTIRLRFLHINRHCFWSYFKNLYTIFLPPTTKLGKGYVLHLSVILFTGGSATHPRADPLTRHLLPAQCMLGYSQQVGSTHPTGMQSCLIKKFQLYPMYCMSTESLNSTSNWIYMSHFAYACKMWYPLNLVLENSEYLLFYWTFLHCNFRLWFKTP